MQNRLRAVPEHLLGQYLQLAVLVQYGPYKHMLDVPRVWHVAQASSAWGSACVVLAGVEGFLSLCNVQGSFPVRSLMRLGHACMFQRRR